MRTADKWLLGLAAASLLASAALCRADVSLIPDVSKGDLPVFGYTPPIMADDAPQPGGQPAAGDDNNVYAPPAPAEGVNNGAVSLDLNFAYVNRYVYRGVDHDALTPGNNLNLLLDGRLSFDFGAYPHPFVEMFSNIEDADPVSRFQEFRPQVGATWNLRPILLEAGATEYEYPQRESFNTEEVYLNLEIDDSVFFHTPDPILSPYMLTAYDYHLNEGWYLEWGLKHDFTIDSIGLKITAEANFAYVNALRTQFIFTNQVKSTGLQHLELGMIGTYSLNDALHLGKRFGELDAKGYLYYDDKLQPDIAGNYVVWGGFGIGFKY